LYKAESQIVRLRYDQGFRDCGLPVPAIATRQQMLGRTPHLVVADAGVDSAKNEAVAQAKGVKRVCVPDYSQPFDQAPATRTGAEQAVSTAAATRRRRHATLSRARRHRRQ
jgi:hypothetical protein